MAQLDFRQAFSTGTENTPSSLESVPHRPASSPAKEHKPASFGRSARLSRSSWTNIVFVTATSLGGLFFVFYFFNGAELLRAALSWPSEYLYRPPGLLAQSEMKDKFQPFAEQGWPFAHDSGTSSGPFSRVGGMNLAPSPAFTSPGAGATSVASVTASTSSAPFTNAGSLLNRLGVLLPGPDGLMQTLNRAVEDLARARQLDVRRTVVVVQTVVKEARPRVTAKKATQGARTAATNGIDQAASQDSPDAAQSAAGAAQNQTAGPVTTTNAVGSQTMNSIRGMTSGPLGGLGGGHAPVSLPGGRH